MEAHEDVTEVEPSDPRATEDEEGHHHEWGGCETCFTEFLRERHSTFPFVGGSMDN